MLYYIYSGGRISWVICMYEILFMNMYEYVRIQYIICYLWFVCIYVGIYLCDTVIPL